MIIVSGHDSVAVIIMISYKVLNTRKAMTVTLTIFTFNCHVTLLN